MPVVIPGYADALARERFIRASCFVADREYICGVPVLPLNIWHVVALDAIDSPFVKRSDALTATDILNFMWLIQPNYSASRLDKRWFWVTRLRSLPAEKTIRAIVGYITEAYSDSPGGEAGAHAVSYYSSAAALVDCLAKEYGWSEAEIMRIPLKRAFQYSKLILHRLNPKAPLWNPSDKVKGDWLNTINRTN